MNKIDAKEVIIDIGITTKETTTVEEIIPVVVTVKATTLVVVFNKITAEDINRIIAEGTNKIHAVIINSITEYFLNKRKTKHPLSSKIVKMLGEENKINDVRKSN